MIINHPKSFVTAMVIYLSTLVSILGIFIGYQIGFTLLYPMNILIWVLFILWHSDSKRKLLSLLIPFSIGLALRIFTLRYAWVIGSYEYGETLDYKIYGTPIIVGFAWIAFSYSTAGIAQRISNRILITTLISSFLAIGLHLLFAISAPKVGLWKFKEEDISVHYSAVMLGIALITQFSFQKSIKSFNLEISIPIFLSILAFAISFLFL